MVTIAAMNDYSPFTPPNFTKPGDKQHWGQLYGSAQALSLAETASRHNSLTLVVTPDTATATRLMEELHFFLGHSEDNTTPDLPLLQFPDWETLPYDSFSPHQDIISQRLATLYQLPTTSRGILVVPVTTLMHRILPPDYLSSQSLVLSCGQSFDVEAMRTRLQKSGYHCVDTVFEHGEFAVRGSLIDLFPMGSQVPYRIDLFDDEVETLRTFDPETQRTIERVESIGLLPAKEFPLNKQGIAHFKEQWHERFNVDHRKCSVYRDISDGISPPGIEYYLPLFYPDCSTLLDYLPGLTQVVTLGKLEPAADSFWRELSQRYDSRCVDPERPILPPNQVFINTESLFQSLKAYPRAIIHSETADRESAGHFNFASRLPPSLPINAHAENPLTAIEAFLLEYNGRVLFCAESAGRRETLLELLARIGVKPDNTHSWKEFLESKSNCSIVVAPLEQGLQLIDPEITVVSEAQLFGERVQQRRRRKSSQGNADMVVKNLTELNIGAPVVHIDHGVGRYRGLQRINIDGQESEFLTLEYADEAKLYVPVDSLHLISRYSGADADTAPLHKLGSEQWQKAKRKAAEKVRDVAAELLDIYARRAARKGFAFSDPETAYESFCAGFPFEETDDQATAIEAVRKDMLSNKPMDRLVCGDVGFGKTEVAMRAAFIAAHSGKQVAILVPTTLLAQQHFESLKDRFAEWPVNVELLSRFRTAGETDAVQKKLASGQVDIVVGTHKILQSGLNYKALGLLIIDEEHRFGVRQKDKLKSLRSEVDILTLTATPIPRTLNMSIAGIRDLSIIATPPAKRLSVKTFVRQSDNALIKEAILRELLRGGQVYYLHNEVKDIEKVARELQEMIPEARVAVGHGQMRERELESVMADFYHKRFNVLVCTTIIETGIDVPSANTIVIDRADKFGLAQLHQLRGRVGRSHHQAYAYLLTPEQRAMSADAIKRLDAISNATDLGAGFTLATHDMEIRGAGELLGDGQSGQIQSVGFSLYMDMLDRAVKSIQAGKEPNIDQPLGGQIEVNLRIPALIPDDYLPDVHTRLIMYKRLAGAKDEEELRELQVEMIDRFGLLPESTKNLVRVTELKLEANTLGIQKLEASAAGGNIEFSSDTRVDPLSIVKMVQTQPQIFRLEGANKLKFKLALEQADDRLTTLSQLLKALTSKEQAA